MLIEHFHERVRHRNWRKSISSDYLTISSTDGSSKPLKGRQSRKNWNRFISSKTGDGG
jgi:hypothetical protein